MVSNTAVYGLYQSPQGVESVVNSLRYYGFPNSHISVLVPHSHNPEGEDLGRSRRARSTASIRRILTWLAGFELLVVPGVRSFIAAGPILALGGHRDASSYLTDFIVSLTRMGMTPQQARKYEVLTRNGSILVAIHCSSADWVDRAQELMRNTDAQYIATAFENNDSFLLMTPDRDRQFNPVSSPEFD